jgi:hypothetical protein
MQNHSDFIQFKSDVENLMKQGYNVVYDGMDTCMLKKGTDIIVIAMGEKYDSQRGK